MVKRTPRPHQKKLHKDAVIDFKFRKFEDVRTYAQALNFSSKKQWYAWAKTSSCPEGMPTEPQIAYAKKGWISWGDFLGTGSEVEMLGEKRRLKTFQEAKNFAVSLNLKGQKEWYAMAQTSALPDDIPANPDKYYAKLGWKSWVHFLGAEKKAQ